MCGYDGLWRALTAREVLAHVPTRPNTLIVYGPARRPDGRLLPEEYAATHTEKMWPYDGLMEAMQPTRYDRMIDQPYAAKPSGAAPLPEVGTLWTSEDEPGYWRVYRVDEDGVVTMQTEAHIISDPRGSFRHVRWWTDERNQWGAVS
jgi:hypothetical protein